MALINALETIYQQSVHVSAPLQALDGYWLAISAHNFAGALRYVVPSVVGSAFRFVSSEHSEGVHSAQFQGRVISQRGSTATVRIVSLTTHNQRYSCRTWTGTYKLSRRGGRWLIQRANITPAPCRSS